MQIKNAKSNDFLILFFYKKSYIKYFIFIILCFFSNEYFFKMKKIFEKQQSLKKNILVPFLSLFYCLKPLPNLGKVFKDFLF